MTDETPFEAAFRAAAGPRPLPDDLQASLVEACALASADHARPLPQDLRERLIASPRWRFGARLQPRPLVLTVAAVTIAVLMVAGGVAIAVNGGGGEARFATGTTTTTALTPSAGDPTDGLDAATRPTPVGPTPDATTTTTTARPAPKKPVPVPPPPPSGSGLTLPASCDSLLDRLRDEAGSRVGPYGVQGGRGSGAVVARAAVVADGGAAPAPDASETNVQEAGVDEPDAIKNDASRLFVVGTTLRTFSLGAGTVEPRAELTFDYGYEEQPTEMVVAGNRVVVLGTITRHGANNRPLPPRAAVWIVDVSDLGAPRRIATYEFDGSIAGARAVNGIVRLVTRTFALGPEMTSPEDPSSEESRNAATEENRRRIAASTPADWLPHYRLTLHDPAGDKTTEGLVCACEGTFVPDTFGGFESLAVTTIDPANPERRASTSIEGGAGIVYGNRDRLYVATQPWATVESDAIVPLPHTDIHRFSFGGEGAMHPAHDASGPVPGALLNQFSMSEHDGLLRVASTRFDRSSGQTESLVTVLGRNGTGLGVVGQVSGLGKGERIFGVRFQGTTGYVVTFRRTDPLYVVDLVDPTAPAVKGELKIPGYSAYLHPIEDGRLLGVGQDATDEGQATGLQVSLFDVRNPSAPTRTHQKVYSGTWSEAEWNHHAFLRWQPTGTTVVPLSTYTEGGDGKRSSVALVLRTGPDRLDEQGRLTHDGRPATEGRSADVKRSFVARGHLYTVSDAGILVNELESLDERRWLAL